MLPSDYGCFTAKDTFCCHLKTSFLILYYALKVSKLIVDQGIGEHNQYVFGDLLGTPSAEIDQLVAEKIIY